MINTKLFSYALIFLITLGLSQQTILCITRPTSQQEQELQEAYAQMQQEYLAIGDYYYKEINVLKDRPHFMSDEQYAVKNSPDAFQRRLKKIIEAHIYSSTCANINYPYSSYLSVIIKHIKKLRNLQENLENKIQTIESIFKTITPTKEMTSFHSLSNKYDQLLNDTKKLISFLESIFLTVHNFKEIDQELWKQHSYYAKEIASLQSSYNQEIDLQKKSTNSAAFLDGLKKIITQKYKHTETPFYTYRSIVKWDLMQMPNIQKELEKNAHLINTLSEYPTKMLSYLGREYDALLKQMLELNTLLENIIATIDILPEYTKEIEAGSGLVTGLV